jgi:hypothetical protein
MIIGEAFGIELVKAFEFAEIGTKIVLVDLDDIAETIHENIISM